MATKKSINRTGEFAFPPEIRAALSEMKFRVYEAASCAELLKGYVRGTLPANLDQDTVDNAVSAIVRLLKSVDGLDDVEYLSLLAKERGLAEVAHG